MGSILKGKDIRMGHKRVSAVEPQKEATQKENGGWIFSMMSSKWFIFLILLLAGIVWYSFYATHTKGITGSDDREYVSMARNIVNGKGIVRNFMYPVDINFFGKLPLPEFHHPPGYTLIIAGFFKLFGVSDFVALLPSYLSYFILIVLFFYFVKKYLEIETAVVAALILIFNKEILDMSLVALSEAVYILSFFLFFILFVKAKSLRDIFAAGILLGISHLIRKTIYPFLLPLFIYLYFYPNLPRWKKMIFFAIGLVIPIIPNMIRSFLDTGSISFSYGDLILMAYSQKYPWLNIFRGIENPSLFEFLTEEPGQFLLKYMNNFVKAFEEIMTFSNPYLMVFFIVEMFYWKINPEWKRIKILFIVLLVSQILFIPLHTIDRRYFIPFLPMMTMFASQHLLRIGKYLAAEVKIHWKKRMFFLITFLFLIFFVIPTTYLIIVPNGPPILNFKTPQFGLLIPKEEADKLNAFLKSELKENQVVWTDLPEILEWEGDRLCGWLPTRIEHIYEIHKKIPVDAILLTNLRTPAQMEEAWKYLLFSERSLPLYRNVKLYKSRWVFAKLLIRDERE